MQDLLQSHGRYELYQAISAGGCQHPAYHFINTTANLLYEQLQFEQLGTQLEQEFTKAASVEMSVAQTSLPDRITLQPSCLSVNMQCKGV